MAKSKRKSGSSTDVSRWETELAQANFSEDDWKTLVVFAVPNQIEDVQHCNILSESISTGLRKCFSVIEFESLLKEIKDLVHGKVGKVKMSKPPPFFEVIDSIKVHIEQDDDVPPNLLAKLLKFKLLMIKQKDLERREDEKKAAEAAAKQAKQEERSRSNAGSSPGKRSKSQSPGRKKGKRDDAPPSPKKDTKLKRRGELEDTFKTIDDEPDGPNDPSHYIVITSIYEPRVFQPLIDLGVSIDAVIKVKSETYVKEEEKQVRELEEDQDAEDEQREEAERNEELKKNEEKTKERLQKFWKESEMLVKEAASGTKMKGIANLSVTIKDHVVPDGDIKEIEQDKKTEYGTKLFEYAANLCYDLLDSRKRYQRYIDNLKLTHIPLLRETTTLPKSVPLTASVTSAVGGLETAPGTRQGHVPCTDMRYYNHLIDQIPCESHSIPLLLDSMLRQVEATVDQKDPMDDPPPPREDLLERSLGEYFDTKLEILGLKSPVKQTAVVEEVQNKPVLIHHGDDRTARTHHLSKMPDVFPVKAEENIYELHPLASTISSFASNDDDLKSVLTRKQQLAFCCSMQDNPSKFDKIMALMSLEVMPLKDVDADGEVSGPFEDGMPCRTGWDDPYSLSEDVIVRNGAEGVDEAIRDLKSLRNLSEYQYSEYFDSKIFLQVLDQAMDLRPYIDMYYHRGLSSLFLVLHNPKSEELKNCKSWDTWLHSNVGFRNYLEHVAEDVEDWQKEEDIQEEIRNRPVTPQTPPREPTPVPIKSGSSQKLITRAELLEMKEAEEDKSKKKTRKSRAQSRSPGKRPPSDTKKMHSPDKREKTSSAMKRTPSARKAGSRAGTARKSLKSQQEKKPETEETKESETIDEKEKEYPFHGYDVGDELVRVSGETSYLFPSDGGLIKVEKSNYVNGNASIRTAVYKNDHVMVLNVKNPISQFNQVTESQSLETIQSMEPIKSEDTENDDQTEEAVEENELTRLLTDIPTLPEISEPCCEDSYLTINCKDGMRIGIDCRTSKLLRDKLDRVASSVNNAKNAVVKPPGLGASHNQGNPKANSPKGKRNKEDELKKQEELERQHERETREKIENAIKDVFQARRLLLSAKNLSVGCPDGLQLTFLHDEIKNEDSKKVLYVRQEYIVKGSGKHTCEQVKTKAAIEEASRLITNDGTVIKYMRDGHVEVLFSDGSVSNCSSYNVHRVSFANKSIMESRLSVNVEATPVDVGGSVKKSLTALKQVSEAVNELSDSSFPEWHLVNTSGERYRRNSINGDAKLPDLIVSRAVCPRTNQIVETREDGVITVKRPDGTKIVEHCDGTRITTFFADIASGTDNETGEKEMMSHGPMEFVKVECVGYSTVLINKESGEIKTLFGNGNVISASLSGEYKISKPDTSVIFVNDKGETLFVPKNTVPDISTYKVGNLASLFNHIEENGPPNGVYIMKPSAIGCLSTVDDLNNHFTVSSSGEAMTKKSNAIQDGKDPLPPRYFVLHKDGSGEELLRHEDILDFIKEAEKDPTVAMLRSDSKAEDGFSGLTILRPYKGTNSEVWLMNKDEKEIIPSDLKERDFKTMPAREIKTAGPKFGSNAGIAFQVATKPQPKQARPLKVCPNVLEMRYITQFSGLTTDDRRKMIDGIEKYRRFIKEQMETEKGLLPDDPRDEMEKKRADELLLKFKQLEVNQGSNDDHAKGNAAPGNAADFYLEATESPPSPQPERAKPQRSIKEWEKDKIEIAELKYAKEYLRSGIVPPYFDTEEGQRFLYASKGQTDLDRIASDLAKETVHPSYRPVSATSTDSNVITPDPSSMSNPSGDFYDLRKQNQINGRQESNSVDVFDASMKVSPMDSKLSLSRPGNPTPAEGINGDSGLGIHRDSQSRSRPYNPTPLHATKNSSLIIGSSMHESINEKPESGDQHQPHFQNENLLQSTLKKQQLQELASTQDGLSSQAYFMPSNKDFIAESQSGEPSPRFSGLNYTVTGDPRKEAVKLPTSIQGSKPGGMPNSKFINVEEPVRRQVKTASVAGTVKPESTSKLRGFQLYPDYVDFGVLKEGMSYSYTVMLKNVGIDSCRFKVKQPPPSTGLKVIYNPGPVAAGMATRLDVEIFAVAVGVEGSPGVGSVGHHIEVITETDALYLPVSATILTVHEYDYRSEASPRGGPSTNTLLLSNRPSSRDAITRPRKD